MLEKVKTFVSEHKDQVIEGASNVVGSLLGLFVGMLISQVSSEEEYLSDEEESTEVDE